MLIKKIFSFLLLLVIGFTFQGCFNKSHLERKEMLFQEVWKGNITYQHLILSSKINLISDGKKQNLKGTLELEYRKHLLATLSFLGIKISKTLIKPNHITFYEKLLKQYYNGDKSRFLNKFIGLDVDLTVIQNLLLGNPLVEINNLNKLTFKRKGLSNLIKGTLGKNLSYLIFLDKKTKRVTSQRLIFKKISLTVFYEGFNEKIKLPQQLHIEIKKNNSSMIKIKINHKRVLFLDKNIYKVNVPKDYKEIKL